MTSKVCPIKIKDNLVELIKTAFENRTKPISVIAPDTPNTHDVYEALHFQGMSWDAPSAQEWHDFSDALSRFSTEAFCYYLAGILCLTIKEGEIDLEVVNHIIESLDRSPTPEYWDGYFLSRWPALSRMECDAVAEWIIWLSQEPDNPFSDDSLMRAYESMALVKQSLG
ncbi:hypothetical protein [Burkholderia sp. Ac-20379]|uniref:hypothetical protein n=1 Tax=Burkholderia sp. Ac-20379 TaxID=2703900 RepID=UPI00197D9631|nr:hypothetical protein [Burkholderia sp. Ac-20379]MBN3726532.1 hypothetical protein [Burkholderia sp. Ac-20379]